MTTTHQIKQAEALMEILRLPFKVTADGHLASFDNGVVRLQAVMPIDASAHNGSEARNYPSLYRLLAVAADLEVSFDERRFGRLEGILAQPIPRDAAGVLELLRGMAEATEPSEGKDA
jgi:hypothetical protein